MKIHQISLFAENKPGQLLAPVQLLAGQGIDISSLFLADTEQYGVLRMIVSDWRKAAELLEGNGFVIKVTEVLAVEVADQPGGLAGVLTALDGAGINVEYMYAFPIACDDRAILIFRFNDPDAAIERLQSAGFNLLHSGELLER
jgi:hypothetical protein